MITRLLSSFPRGTRLCIAGLMSVVLLPCSCMSVMMTLGTLEPGYHWLSFVLLCLLTLGLLWACVTIWSVSLRRYPIDEDPHRICRGCGYDRRGLAGGACPECGRSTDGG